MFYALICSKIYHVRELAAQCLVNITCVAEKSDVIAQAIKLANQTKNVNTLHGIMCLVCVLLSNLRDVIYKTGVFLAQSFA